MVKPTQAIRWQIAPQKQLTFICSKSTIETLEKGASMFKVNNKITGTTSLMTLLNE